jgi:hypothetical protein
VSTSRGTLVVQDLITFIRRYVVLSPAQLLVTSLWVVHSHAVDAAESSPYLAVTSPEPGCGKTRYLEVLEMVVARPWLAVTPSEAVVYRRIEALVPTLLMDEVDAVFSPKVAERHEGLRALLNSGNRRGATVPRCLGTSAEIVEFHTFCPKVLAGIGTLPDTISSRSVPIRLERRTKNQELEVFRRRDVEPAGEKLRDRIEVWAARHETALAAARPDMPQQMSDRMQDGCEPLLAIADVLHLGSQARKALLALLTAVRLDSQETMQLTLLRDVHSVLNGHRSISSRALLTRLHQLEEAPWSTYYGRSLDERDLARLLHPYGIKSKVVRVKLSGGLSKTVKGYSRDDLHPVFERYVGPDDA